MRNFFFPGIIAIILFFPLSSITTAQQIVYTDNFSDVSEWKSVVAEEVVVSVDKEKTLNGFALKIDYSFNAGSGYGGIQKIVPISLPDNYEFSFRLKADSPNNDFEFKLLDEEGTSVWWMNRRNFTFPKEWQYITIKKRQIQKAWGPSTDFSPTKIHRLEFTIASVNGGKGTIYIEDFKLVEKPLPSFSNSAPVLKSLSQLNSEYPLANIFDKNLSTEWRSGVNQKKEEIIVDFLQVKELGGLTLYWDSINYPRLTKFLVSDDAKIWREVYSISNGKGNYSFIYLPETETRFIKIQLEKSNGSCFALKELVVEPLSIGANLNSFIENASSKYPRGYYPKYFTPEKSYFTITGVNNDVKEALINEEGQVEVDKSNFSIEPFIYCNDEFLTWSNFKNTQSLEEEYLPIPIVTRENGLLNLEVKIFADGEAGNSVLNLQYKLTNKSNSEQRGRIFFTIRPFQVNPSYQFLNTSGGVARVESISFAKNNVATVNGEKIVIPLITPTEVGVSGFDQGEIVEFISKNQVPDINFVSDKLGLASGVYAYNFAFNSNESQTFSFLIPFHQKDYKLPNFNTKEDVDKYISIKLNSISNFWKSKLNSFDIHLPDKYKKWTHSLRTTLAYILINRDNAGIQPGSRSYERSWIRDGSLTSSALLKLGIKEEVREFIDWYSSYQYPSGKVPCVVDRRGPDPVPENDSHGQLIYLIHQYYLFTKDTTFLRAKFANVVSAVNYLEELIAQRSTLEYASIDSLKPYYGILPESISHEGYSEKPMHSYWDNFFAMKGLKDAVEIASILNEENYVKKFILIRDKFKRDLYNSLSSSIEIKGIDFIPGCVELGDFDATSTAIALYPSNEKNNLPQPFLQNTFDRYFDFFMKRRDDTTFNWVNYTPYELRTVGAYIQLSQPERSHDLMNYFFNDQRPQGWNHWAEVVWKDPKLPRFIGDMPHTWVGSDFISSLRSFFIYEDEERKAIVLGAGVIPEWIESQEGIKISNLKSYYGTITYSIKKLDNNKVSINTEGHIILPSGGIIIKNPYMNKIIKSVTVNKKEIDSVVGNEILIYEHPATVELRY
ncbi:MAG: discoidin domain-containing protein [Ignavibacteriaceae bacterium]|nr:discoidin domain-containing protein [Ignavibacteriaceae bacterium]